MKNARLLVLDVIGNTGFYEIECNELDDLYRGLKCDCFDVVNRSFGNKRFDIFCDDNGLFQEKPIVSSFDTNLEPMLVGNLIFANHDSAGETTSLTEDDIKTIKSRSVGVLNTLTGVPYTAVVCGY